MPPMKLDFAALDHIHFMKEALKEAEVAVQSGELPIGAVIVHEGKVIARGHAHHVARGSKIAHAEMNALLEAERYLNGCPHECVIYSTVEPCVMCLGAIVMSNISHIVFALPDNWIKPREMLNMDYVRRHIIEYVGGVLADDSLALWRTARPQDIPLLLDGLRG
jgi:tRNA(adenine34) deaminase